jgi:hypothetical protein
VVALGASGLGDQENAKITVSDEQTARRGPQDNFATQRLFAQVQRAQGAVQSRPAEGTEADGRAH